MFDQEFLDILTTSDWFKDKTLSEINVYMETETDYTKYDPEHPFRRLSEKFISENGVKISLPDHVIAHILIYFTFEQAFYILFGHWIGLTKSQIESYSYPIRPHSDMQNIFHCLTLHKIPEQDIRETCKGKFFRRKLAKLLKEHQIAHKKTIPNIKP